MEKEAATMEEYDRVSECTFYGSAELRALREEAENIISLPFTEEEFASSAVRVQRRLASQGWYLPFGSLIPIQVVALGSEIDTMPQLELERTLIEFARIHLDEVQQTARACWPERAHILDDAFSAHRKGLYTLSIPALLAQADGISQDLLGTQMYKRKRGQPCTSEAIDISLANIDIKYVREPRRLGALDRMIFDPLRSPNALSENSFNRDSKKVVDQEVKPLNRHGVIHGSDTDYPTESNSFRCIMMLGYLGDVCELLRRLAEHTAALEKIMRDAMRKIRGEI
jgi:hypothetical protein